jgi:4-alpha-glucanotransferase
LNRTVHTYLARANTALAMAQIDDLTREIEPVNVPTTSSEHPNWRRRLRLTLEELAADRDFEDVVRIFAAERPPEGSDPHG